MKILTLIAAASVAAVTFANDAAPAAEKGEGRPARPPMGERMRRGTMAPGMMMQDPLLRAVMNPAIAEKVGITAEQKAKLGDSAELRAKSRELQKKVSAGMKRQLELLAAEKIDEAAVMAVIDEVFEARKALAKEQTKRVIALRTILTPEQVAKIREAMKSLSPRREGPGRKHEKGGRKAAPAPKEAPKAE